MSRKKVFIPQKKINREKKEKKDNKLNTFLFSKHELMNACRHCGYIDPQRRKASKCPNCDELYS